MRSRNPLRATVLVPLAVTLAGPALAEDAVKPPTPALPGVEPGYTLVKPMPEPDDMPDQGAGGAHFKVGDVDVHVSGSITVDVGVGATKPPRR